MNENTKFTPPTVAGVALTTETLADWPASNDTQRDALAALWNVANTLTGIDTVEAWGLREEYCQRSGRVNKETRTAKAKGGVFKFGSEQDFVKAGVRPPTLAPLLEAADLVYKLRKLAVMGKDHKLDARLVSVRAHNAEKYSALAV